MTPTWIELREPGMVPEHKGPFNTPVHLKQFLIELFDVRPAALVSVMTMHSSGPSFEDGPQVLEMMDGRQRHRAERHRRNTEAAWRAPR